MFHDVKETHRQEDIIHSKVLAIGVVFFGREVRVSEALGCLAVENAWAGDCFPEEVAGEALDEGCFPF